MHKSRYIKNLERYLYWLHQNVKVSKSLRILHHQVLIASELIVNKSKKSTNILIKHLLPHPKKPLQPQTGEQKPED